jgi:tetratricopeptide (TPR) repeat protein
MENVREHIQRAEAYIKNGNWTGANKVLETVITALKDSIADPQSKKLLAEALRLNAFAVSRIGDHKTAVTDAKTALELSLELGDLEAQADALRRLGYVHWQKTDYPMALEFYEAALQKAMEAKAPKLVGKTMIEMGNLYNSMASFEKARTSYLKAAVIMKEEKELNELARIYNNLGSMYLRENRWRDALKVLGQCMTLADQIGDMTIKGWAAFNTASGLLKLNQPQDALDHLNTAMTLLRRSDDRIGVMTTYMVYGSVYSELKDWDKALASFKKATAIVKDLQMPSMEAEILGELGKMYTAKGNRPAARETLCKAIEMYEGLNLASEAKELRVVLDGLGTRT